MTINSESIRPAAARPLGVVQVDASQQTLVDVLITVAKSTRALLGLRLAAIGFHSGQDDFLLSIDDHEMVSITALSERLGIRPSTVSKMTDRLEDRDLVRRVADKQDTRRTMLSITPSGIAAKAVIRGIHDDVEIELLRDMLRGDAATMREGLLMAQARLNDRLLRLR